MIYSIRMTVEVDPSSNFIPADEREEFLSDLIMDLLYDADDVTITSITVDKEA